MPSFESRRQRASGTGDRARPPEQSGQGLQEAGALLPASHPHHAAAQLARLAFEGGKEPTATALFGALPRRLSARGAAIRSNPAVGGGLAPTASTFSGDTSRAGGGTLCTTIEASSGGGVTAAPAPSAGRPILECGDPTNTCTGWIAGWVPGSREPGPLTGNCGPSETMALQPGSPGPGHGGLAPTLLRWVVSMWCWRSAHIHLAERGSLRRQWRLGASSPSLNRLTATPGAV